MRPPQHKPNGSDKMQNHHYAAIFASFMHCQHTCGRGLQHKDPDHHALHSELEKYPSKKRTGAILDSIMADMLFNERDIPPHLRAAFCTAHNDAKAFLNG